MLSMVWWSVPEGGGCCRWLATKATGLSRGRASCKQQHPGSHLGCLQVANALHIQSTCQHHGVHPGPLLRAKPNRCSLSHRNRACSRAHLLDGHCSAGLLVSSPYDRPIRALSDDGAFHILLHAAPTAPSPPARLRRQRELQSRHALKPCCCSQDASVAYQRHLAACMQWRLWMQQRHVMSGSHGAHPRPITRLGHCWPCKAELSRAFDTLYVPLTARMRAPGALFWNLTVANFAGQLITGG